MISREVVITAPYAVDVRTVDVPSPGAGQVRVKTRVTGVSPGTELLAYRGQLPSGPGDDATIDPLAGVTDYPMQTGYCLVGTVDELGDGVDLARLGQRVFTFYPHASHAIVESDSLVPLPDDVPDEVATFIPNLETAFGLVMDGRPVLGERVVVLGQGVVGQLVTRLLSCFPLGVLATADHIPARRERSIAYGATLAVDPSVESDRFRLTEALGVGEESDGADLVFELTGNPDALNDAISLAGFGGRVVAGSWYGSKAAPLDLGGRFHRNRISLTSSQVSTIAPELTARWSKRRRMKSVLRLLTRSALEELISHRFSIGQAAEAFELLDSRQDETMQVVLICEDDLIGGHDV